MLKSLIAASACAVLLGTVSAPASAGGGGGFNPPGCHVPGSANNGMQQSDGRNERGAIMSFFSSNTDAGNGNGGEIASIFGCIDGIDFPDDQVNVNVNEGSPFFVTDPGNSLPND